MNSLLRLTSVTAFTALTIATAPAQSLTITAPGYTGTKLFDSTAGYTITGMGVDASGDVFYLETDNGFAASTRLYRRSPSDNYATATPIYNFGSFVFGSFVAVNGSKVFFGESSTGKIQSINLDGSGVDLLGTLTGNYDAAFSGGRLFLNYNLGPGTKSKVSAFDLVADGTGGLMLSTADIIVDASGDYSGPLEFGSGGSLFYGGGGTLPNLFRFSSSEVTAAFDSGPTLFPDATHQFLGNGANAYLAFDGNLGLWQSDYGSLHVINSSDASNSTIGTSADSIGQLDYVNGKLFASVTRFSASSSSSVYTVAPEPTCATLLLVGALGLSTRRRR